MAPPAQTFLFADITGFTALTEAHGDEAAADLVQRFCDAVGSVLPEYGAAHVKTIGDAVMLRAEEPAQAVRLALRITGEVMRAHGLPTARVGLHHGQAVERDGDWFGAAVNLAARVTGEAAGGEVLLTPEAREAAGELAGIAFVSRGARPLRNVREPVELFAAMPVGQRTPDGWVIDPVCRMAIDPVRAAASIEHDGSTYLFCSSECAAAFAARPEAYVSPSAP